MTSPAMARRNIAESIIPILCEMSWWTIREAQAHRRGSRSRSEAQAGLLSQASAISLNVTAPESIASAIIWSVALGTKVRICSSVTFMPRSATRASAGEMRECFFIK